jgi:hypothetical protein
MTPADKKRFAVWVAYISNPKTGIPDPTEQEVDAVIAIPCKYWRAARASRA